MEVGNREGETLYVSTDGNDHWSGRLPEPNAEATDGPFATIRGAQQALRVSKQMGRLTGPVTVWIRGGRYCLGTPLVFGPEDSGPVTYAAYAGEEVILDGGRRIENWRAEQLRGISVWMAELPEVAAGERYYHQLFVDDRRCPRTCLPAEGWFQLADIVTDAERDEQVGASTDTFICAEGEFRAWRNLTDVEVVLLHNWVEVRMQVASFDEAPRTVRCTRRSGRAVRPGERYYIENVFEALTEPGRWYLDRPTGRLYYVPLPGESIEEVEAFVALTEQLLRIEGEPERGRYVEGLRFEGVIFEHTAWRQPPGGWRHEPDPTAAGTPQASENVPGVLSLRGARTCALESCTVRHVGWYGIELGHGCCDNRVVGNEICDLGAGGVLILDGPPRSDRRHAPDHPPGLRTGNNVITDNHVHHGGRICHSAVGVLCTQSFGNDLSHNHIHDFYYTGISCGFTWGYSESLARDNRIEKNHIHHIGGGMLSDMGGIYTLGVQPGTVVRGNLIHDVEAWSEGYGGWAIYPDEGSSEMVIEDNLCYDTSDDVFHMHYGRECIVRNNIFAFGRKGQVSLSKAEEHVAFTLERNIIISAGAPFVHGYYAWSPEQQVIRSEGNIFWDVSAGAGVAEKRFAHINGRVWSLDEWRALGYDGDSIVADPLFADAAGRDFTLAEDSPAFKLGFRPIDLSDVGPRQRRGG